MAVCCGTSSLAAREEQILKTPGNGVPKKMLTREIDKIIRGI
jgi:hypothetical protein